jgi:hypothetical protein
MFQLSWVLAGAMSQGESASYVYSQHCVSALGFGARTGGPEVELSLRRVSFDSGGQNAARGTVTAWFRVG